MVVVDVLMVVFVVVEVKSLSMMTMLSPLFRGVVVEEVVTVVDVVLEGFSSELFGDRPGKIDGHKAAPMAPIATPTGKATDSNCFGVFTNVEFCSLSLVQASKYIIKTNNFSIFLLFRISRTTITLH